MRNEKLQLTGHCYVLMRGNWIHPIAYRRDELVWYPETGMNAFDVQLYQPYVKSVVTENPTIIACYPRERVRVLCEETGTWVMADSQTYGASYTSIQMHYLYISSTIPSMVLDGGCRLREKIEKYSKMVELASANK